MSWLLFALSLCCLGFFTGCCCGTNCTLFFDDFNRADSSSLGSDWTETAGNWTITSNKLQITTANAVCTSTYSPGGENVSISATVHGTASGDKIRLGHTATVKIICELEIGTGVLRLYVNPGGGGAEVLARECSVSAAINTDHALRMTTERTTSASTTTCFLNGVPYIALSSYVNVNAVCAVGTGDTVTGTVTFDDFRIETSHGFDNNPANYPSCPAPLPGCWPIVSGANPAQIQAVVSGINTAVFCSSGECSALNGTYVLDKVGIDNARIPQRNCLQYELTGLSLACGGTTVTKVRVSIGDVAPGSVPIPECGMYLQFYESSGPTHAWAAYGAIGPVVAFDAMHPGPPTGGCGSAAVTIPWSTSLIGAYNCSGGQAILTPV